MSVLMMLPIIMGGYAMHHFWIYSTSLSFFFPLFLITFSVYAKNSLQEDLGGAMFAVYVSMLVCM